jgi:DNA-directed RNA polymerase specialized sigma24 family protein
MPRLAQAPGPDWLPLAEAAEVLGVSVDTARRRVRRW